mmetsp:Transcript_49114/g.106812  ORF Transcript_49114/g.106812 Transcript_49114/m.106812 type:complete len:220 (-) Transcript_49114:393-1052(-)
MAAASCSRNHLFGVHPLHDGHYRDGERPGDEERQEGIVQRAREPILPVVRRPLAELSLVRGHPSAEVTAATDPNLTSSAFAWQDEVRVPDLVELFIPVFFIWLDAEDVKDKLSLAFPLPALRGADQLNEDLPGLNDLTHFLQRHRSLQLNVLQEGAPVDPHCCLCSEQLNDLIRLLEPLNVVQLLGDLERGSAPLLGSSLLVCTSGSLHELVEAVARHG